MDTSTSISSAGTEPGGVGTVFIETPFPYTTVTSFTDDGPGGTDTSTQTTSATANMQGTIVVQIPDPYVTSYTQYTGSTISTSIFPPITAGATGTVSVYNPSPTPVSVRYTTVTSAWARSTSSFYTPPITGTVVSVTEYTSSAGATATGPPGANYVTSTVYSGSTVGTTTQVTATGAASGTIVKTYPTCNAGCGSSNSGSIRYGVYTNPFIGYYPGGYKPFDPTVFKKMTPTSTGKTGYIGFYAAGGATTPVYGSAPQSIETLAVDHTFYLCAPVSGYYSFTAQQADDITEYWIGDLALSGWTRANENSEQTYVSNYSAQPPSVFTVYLTQGFTYPIRIMWANEGGRGLFNAAIFAPDGGYILQTNINNPPSGITSPNILSQVCDGSAGTFPAFGAET